jgi:uncharacterized RDD family membrane protein YckC
MTGQPEGAVRSVSVEQTTEPVSTTASLGRRFGALIVDWLLCVVLAGAFAKPAQAPWLAPSILVLEYGLFLGFFAQTPGMWLARIRCVSYENGRAIGAPRALLRGLLLAVLVPALIMDKHQRGLHDRAAGSIVVRVSAPASP